MSAYPSSSRQRAFRICDQCGTPENPSASRFRLCGGCMTTNYCSQECQKAHWASHRQICQHTAAQLSNLQAQQPQFPNAEDIAKNLRKFTSVYQGLLNWAGFQALQLKRIPANVRQNALLVELTPRTGSDSSNRFAVSGTHIVPRSYIQDPLVCADIQRREERCRAAGGIGALVVIIQCGGVSQVMPVEVDPPHKIAWETRADWAEILRHTVDSGRTDFKPSTGARMH